MDRFDKTGGVESGEKGETENWYAAYRGMEKDEGGGTRKQRTVNPISQRLSSPTKSVRRRNRRTTKEGRTRVGRKKKEMDGMALTMSLPVNIFLSHPPLPVWSS